MGEQSKSTGEEGENIAEGFLSLVGWSPLASGIDLKCEQPQRHKRKGSESNRESHGVDFIFSYLCPLEPGIRRHVLISMKNSASDKTTPKRQLVKDDLADVATALVCFRNSKQRNDLNRQGGAKSAVDLGLLIRINKDPDEEKSFLEGLSKTEHIDLEGNATVHFLENARFDFVERCLKHVQSEFQGYTHTYVVSRNALTGSVDVWNTKTAILPIQNLIGGPIVVRLDKCGANGVSESCLAIYSQEVFTIERFKRLTSFAQVITGALVDVTIVFPDFQKLAHSEAVDIALGGLADKDFAKRVRCASSDSRIRVH